MNYFYLDHDPKSLGFVPQNDGFVGFYQADAPNAFYNYLYSGTELDLAVPEGLRIRHRAKLTDMLSIGEAHFHYLIVSARFLALLSTFRLPPHKVFPINAVKGTKVVQYHILVIKHNYMEIIDYEKTAFCIRDTTTMPSTIKPCTITDANEFERVASSLKHPFYLGSTAFKLQDQPKLDLFKLAGTLGASPNYIVTEQLKIATEQSGMTGIQFKRLE